MMKKIMTGKCPKIINTNCSNGNNEMIMVMKNWVGTSKLRLILRLLRKKLFLALIFTLSLSYCLISLMRTPSVVSDADGDLHDYETNVDIDKLNIIPKEPLYLNHDNNSADDGPKNVISDGIKCRNSVQGKVLIADDRGNVCHRKDVLLSGCCDLKSHNTKLYSCDTCQEHGCCSIYEYCISCCMEPSKKPLLNKIIGNDNTAGKPLNVLFASITDHFELCLTKCRTSSASVQHENSYRDPKAKHCYGETNEKKQNDN